jgi:hypothetical protein
MRERAVADDLQVDVEARFERIWRDEAQRRHRASWAAWRETVSFACTARAWLAAGLDFGRGALLIAMIFATSMLGSVLAQLLVGQPLEAAWENAKTFGGLVICAVIGLGAWSRIPPPGVYPFWRAWSQAYARKIEAEKRRDHRGGVST